MFSTLATILRLRLLLASIVSHILSGEHPGHSISGRLFHFKGVTKCKRFPKSLFGIMGYRFPIMCHVKGFKWQECVKIFLLQFNHTQLINYQFVSKKVAFSFTQYSTSPSTTSLLLEMQCFKMKSYESKSICSLSYVYIFFIVLYSMQRSSNTQQKSNSVV